MTPRTAILNEPAVGQRAARSRAGRATEGKGGPAHLAVMVQGAAAWPASPASFVHFPGSAHACEARSGGGVRRPPLDRGVGRAEAAAVRAVSGGIGSRAGSGRRRDALRDHHRRCRTARPAQAASTATVSRLLPYMGRQQRAHFRPRGGHRLLLDGGRTVLQPTEAVISDCTVAGIESIIRRRAARQSSRSSGAAPPDSRTVRVCTGQTG